MPSFRFIGYTLTGLFRKPDNWRQIINKRVRLFIHQTMFREEKIISTSYKIAKLLLNSTFLKKYRSSHQKCRSSHQRCSVGKGVLKNFGNFTGKHLRWSLFLWSCKPLAFKFFKKRLQHKCFPVKFAKLLRIPILRNISKRLLLEVFYNSPCLKTLQCSQDKSSQW